MKIILHYGSGKTGTTSLQASLAAKRRLLAKNGIYYPDTFYPNDAHHLLQTLFKPSEDVMPFLKEHYGGYDAAQKMARKAWRRIERNVKKNQPDVLVLSSEMFFKPSTLAAQQRFQKLVVDLSPYIEPVLYVREPASFYLSKTQQRSKERGFIAAPSAQHIRDSIESIETAFQAKMRIRAFEKAQLLGGDVVQDFVGTYLKDYIASDKIPTLTQNESISPEAMVIASTFRKVNFPDRDMHPNGYSWRLLNEITRIEAELMPAKRPRLKPAIASQIQRSSVDYLWLKQDRGIQFSNLDYAAIDGSEPALAGQDVDWSDIIEVDWARHDKLLHAILLQEMKRGLETSLRIKGIDFRASNLRNNLEMLKAKARSLFSGKR